MAEIKALNGGVEFPNTGMRAVMEKQKEDFFLLGNAVKLLEPLGGKLYAVQVDKDGRLEYAQFHVTS